MFNFFKTVQQQLKIHNLVKQAANYKNHGEAEKALNILETLTQQHPTNVYLRHQTAVLQKELNKEINLPTISQKSNERSYDLKS